MNFEPDQYSGVCCICGTSQLFVRTKVAIRETYTCSTCKGLLRERAQCAVILACYAPLGIGTLADLVMTRQFQEIRLYEPGTTGALRRYFSSLPAYRQSDFYPEETRPLATAQVPHQDLEATDYPNEAFDLIVTSDIMEHVRRPVQAFRECARILRPGGRHIFSVPLQTPMRSASVVRVDTTTDVDRPLLPEHYHGNGKGGRSLVYTDFGMDIVEMLSEAGFSATLEHANFDSELASRAVTVSAIRL